MSESSNLFLSPFSMYRRIAEQTNKANHEIFTITQRNWPLCFVALSCRDRRARVSGAGKKGVGHAFQTTTLGVALGLNPFGLSFQSSENLRAPLQAPAPTRVRGRDATRAPASSPSRLRPLAPRYIPLSIFSRAFRRRKDHHGGRAPSLRTAEGRRSSRLSRRH